MTLPSQMTAMTITRPGGPEVLQLQSAPVPACGADDVLIQIAAAGVNGPDLAQRAGHYDPPPGASPLLGLEVAGVVVARGAAVTDWAPGDRVMALVNGGGYAEYVAVPAGQVLPMPTGWSFAEAAALPETWFTITQSLVMRAGLTSGMVVLVHGASGGIGGAAIQIATALGARAIGIVSTPEKAEYVSRLGAFATIDRTSEDIVERVLTLTDGHGADRIIDVVGGPMAETNIAAAALGGHIIQVSTLGGSSATLSLRALMGKQLTLSGSTLRPQSAATKAAIARRIRTDLLPALGPRMGAPRGQPIPPRRRGRGPCNA
ncbi:MAG TPA: NAD(P)H-quinone oxidoreductase [Devosia sp.]|nr:NAD(P)H-quinone oxidoreductase [Devosia sp.]